MIPWGRLYPQVFNLIPSAKSLSDSWVRGSRDYGVEVTLWCYSTALVTQDVCHSIFYQVKSRAPGMSAGEGRIFRRVDAASISGYHAAAWGEPHHSRCPTEVLQPQALGTGHTQETSWCNMVRMRVRAVWLTCSRWQRAQGACRCS